MERSVSFVFRWMGRKKTRIKRALAVCVLMGFMVYFVAGCENQVTFREQSRQGVVSIPVILTVDPSSGRKNEEELVKAFNQEYQGKYQVKVEWIMETEEEYRKNLKRQNVTGELPAVITDLRVLPSFYQMMVNEGRIENLAPYINADSEWNAMIEPEVREACSEPDGSIYLAPISTNAFSCSGIFWNKKLFWKAGIKKFPETWEKFWKCCDQLEEHGITPLALHTEGTAWAPMLLATAELADSDSGAEYMKQLYPDSYQNENGIHLAETLKRLFQYTTEDALHTDFDVAYSNFVSGKAAMIPNGYWMLDQFPEDFEENVCFSAFPGNKLVSSPETFGWAVVSDYSDEVKQGAVEFLKFRTKFNQKQRNELLDEKADNAPLLQDYIDAFNGKPQIVPNYQVKWNSILQEETLGDCLPELVQGKMTVDEFVTREDESIRQYEEEQ